MEEHDIIILEEDETFEDTGDITLPDNVIIEGTIDPDGIKVYIRHDVYRQIEKYAKEEMSKEVGSILVGKYVYTDKNKAVIITDWIEAKYARSSAATLTFTHETWDYVHEEKSKKYPNLSIVGWQHTHPGYGIFLSNYDTFIQNNFFNLQWQIAYVVDPIADKRGFFQWRDGKISKMSGFYIYGDPDEKILISKKKVNTGSRSLIVNTVLSMLLVISVIVSFLLYFENGNLRSQIGETAEVTETTVNNQTQTTSTQASDIPDSDENTETFNVYTVCNGDCLRDICVLFGIDYSCNIKTIMRINGITNENIIFAGQKLYIPISQ
ncbi:MAG: LysM peptidoglycan-binding domain-containing protein [Clostridia bacterium]|nr:LysM peptidoglycan-binding domain-containing protein [Clostridia bacterium]